MAADTRLRVNVSAEPYELCFPPRASQACLEYQEVKLPLPSFSPTFSRIASSPAVPRYQPGRQDDAVL